MFINKNSLLCSWYAQNHFAQSAEYAMREDANTRSNIARLPLLAENEISKNLTAKCLANFARSSKLTKGITQSRLISLKDVLDKSDKIISANDMKGACETVKTVLKSINKLPEMHREGPLKQLNRSLQMCAVEVRNLSEPDLREAMHNLHLAICLLPSEERCYFDLSCSFEHIRNDQKLSTIQQFLRNISNLPVSEHADALDCIYLMLDETPGMVVMQAFDEVIKICAASSPGTTARVCEIFTRVLEIHSEHVDEDRARVVLRDLLSRIIKLPDQREQADALFSLALLVQGKDDSWRDVQIQLHPIVPVIFDEVNAYINMLDPELRYKCLGEQSWNTLLLRRERRLEEFHYIAERAAELPLEGRHAVLLSLVETLTYYSPSEIGVAIKTLAQITSTLPGDKIRDILIKIARHFGRLERPGDDEEMKQVLYEGWAALLAQTTTLPVEFQAEYLHEIGRYLVSNFPYDRDE